MYCYVVTVGTTPGRLYPCWNTFYLWDLRHLLSLPLYFLELTTRLFWGEQLHLPIDEQGRLEYARSKNGDKEPELPERTNEVTAVYAKQCVELAKELGLPSIDLWSKMQDTEGWQKKILRFVI
ncbi:GDSL esterase/lipase [Abeliophyllum distichum]|uniref:GDSL esterase/lipase n=1 Tax=Abeliophyllum distichum TaxID=126358 RepID=A0ABD1NQ45_9LAMI